MQSQQNGSETECNLNSIARSFSLIIVSFTQWKRWELLNYASVCKFKQVSCKQSSQVNSIFLDTSADSTEHRFKLSATKECNRFMQQCEVLAIISGRRFVYEPSHRQYKVAAAMMLPSGWIRLWTFLLSLRMLGTYLALFPLPIFTFNDQNP
jgi:hypothetical protein